MASTRPMVTTHGLRSPSTARGGGWRPPVVGRPTSLATTRHAWRRSRDRRAPRRLDPRSRQEPPLPTSSRPACPHAGDGAARPPRRSASPGRAAFDEVSIPSAARASSPTRPAFRDTACRAAPCLGADTRRISPSGSDSTTLDRLAEAGAYWGRGSVSGVKQAVTSESTRACHRGLDMFSPPDRGHPRGRRSVEQNARDVYRCPCPYRNTHLEVGEADAVERRVDVAECVAQGGVKRVDRTMPAR